MIGRIACVAAILAIAAPVAMAHGEEAVHLTIEARETGCPGGATFCFVVVSGSLADLGPADDVEIVFRNQGSIGHDLHVTTTARMDPSNQDTDASTAFARIEDVAPGESRSVAFTVPETATGIYFWCDEAGHEAQGMWRMQDFGGGGSDGGGSPGLAATAALLAAAVAIVLVRRR